MFKKSHCIVLFSLLGITCFMSCLNTTFLTKSDFLNSYSSFVNRVTVMEEEGKDLINTDKEFDSYSNEFYTKFRGEMNFAEKKEFWSNTLKYYVVRFDNFGEAMKDAEDRFSDLASEDFEGFLNKSSDEVKEIFKDKLGLQLKDGLGKLFYKANETKGTLKKEIDKLDSDLK